MTEAAENLSSAAGVAIALEKWSKRCEMRGTIEAAIVLASKMLTVEADALDAHPWLLNVRNGVVDLRTGKLRPHDPSLMLTRMAEAVYVPEPEAGGEVATARRTWDRVVLEVCGGDPELADFLRRWFGYCATGQTREQVFVVHWGDGANGKSTLLDTISSVLGDYAGVAAPGLLAGEGRESSGPTPEVAALRGRRMVTAHETNDGVQLREGFVKRITGGDRIVARHLHKEPFEFSPTHKVQLLTNSKPMVKGQDHGIWRRVRLVPYLVRFGSAEEVAEGKAQAVRDVRLMETLSGEAARSAVLGWLIEGAVEWVAGGLQEPPAVLEASNAYRREQDRVGLFVSECCAVDPAASVPLTSGMEGLYPAYQAWCKEGGTHPLARPRFTQEIQRAVPAVKIGEAGVSIGDGRRRTVTVVRGLRLLVE